MAYEHVLFEKRGPVSWIVLNRPERLNAFNTALATEASEALGVAIGDPETRAIVITGRGRAFSVGADVMEVADDPNPQERIRILVDIAHRAILSIRQTDKIVIAAVNHQAAGYGMALALACDLRVATEKVRFYYAYSLLGLTGDGAINLFLPKRVGSARALEVALTGEVLFEEEIAKFGLVTKFFREDSFFEETQSYAERVAACPSSVSGAIKHLMADSCGRDLEEHLEAEKARILDRVGEPEFLARAREILGRSR